ncbi:hypothetical protein FRB90_005575 [Tulasnella sp. 427]|nr:hypothetical protein FRB90_005575 [Tulasnella sp. 427]
MSYYQYYQPQQVPVMSTGGGYYQQGQPMGYAMTGGGYTVAGGTMMQQPMGAMGAYGQPVQYVQAQPTYYPGGQYAYSPNGAATYAYANPPPMHMSQYPAGFAGGVQYIQQTPTGYGQIQPQPVVMAGGTQMGMPMQTFPGQQVQYVQYY